MPFNLKIMLGAVTLANEKIADHKTKAIRDNLAYHSGARAHPPPALFSFIPLRKITEKERTFMEKIRKLIERLKLCVIISVNKMSISAKI